MRKTSSASFLYYALPALFCAVLPVCQVQGAGINTERNNGWFAEPLSAIRTGSEDNPGLPEKFIPQVAVTSDWRVVNYNAVVASMLSALGERKHLKADAPDMDSRYRIPPIGVNGRIWDFVNKDLLREDGKSEPKIEDQLIYVDAWTNEANEALLIGGVYATPAGLLMSFGSDSLARLVIEQSLERQMSKEWTSTTYMEAEYKDMWQKAFPNYGRCQPDDFFLPVDGVDKMDCVEGIQWDGWFYRQCKNYEKARMIRSSYDTYFNAEKWWRVPLNVSIRDTLPRFSNEDLKWWKSGSTRLSWTRMAIINELLADCQYTYESTQIENKIRHEHIDFEPKFNRRNPRAPDVMETTTSLSIPVAFTVKRGLWRMPLKSIVKEDSGSLSWGGLDFDQPVVTASRTQEYSDYVQTPIGQISSPWICISGDGGQNEFDIEFFQNDLGGEDWWRDYLAGFANAWAGLSSDDAFTVQAQGQCRDGESEGECIFSWDDLYLTYRDKMTGQITNIVYGPVEHQECKMYYAVKGSIDISGTLELNITGGCPYYKPLFDENLISDDDIIHGFDDRVGIETPVWDIIEKEKWYNWQCYRGDNGSHQTRLRTYTGSSLEKLQQKRCEDVRQLAESIWQLTVADYGSDPSVSQETPSEMRDLMNDAGEALPDLTVTAWFDDVVYPPPPAAYHVKFDKGEVKDVWREGTSDEDDDPPSLVGKGVVSYSLDTTYFKPDSPRTARFQSYQNILRERKWRWKNMRRPKSVDNSVGD